MPDASAPHDAGTDVSIRTDVPVTHDVQAIPVDVQSIPDACGSTGLTPVTDIMVSPPFDSVYHVYDIGSVPGLPSTRYGGCLVDSHDPNVLYIGVDSEAANGTIWAVNVRRDGCGHIVGYNGVARHIADTPYVDANLFYGQGGLVLYTEWPVNHFAELRPGATMPALDNDLAMLGLHDSPGGAAFVPPGFGGAGELRMVGWPSNGWYHVPFTIDATGLYQLATATMTVTLPNGSGGFAYVPAGSALFARPSVVVAEWSNSVSAFEVDASGDPIITTRRPFLTNLSLAWGAYFEPVTGDYMFPTWGSNRLIIVQGFVAPPPPPG